MMAVMYNQYYIALLLLQNGADGRTPVVSESSQWENDPPLLQVVQANSLEHTPELVFALANEIIEHGGDVNEARAYVATATPLNYALSRSDRPEILELLLQRGAVLIPFSGVDEAVGFTHVPIVRLTQVDNRKHRVEDDVFEKAIMAAVRCLIQGGASLNWVNRQGDTALHAAYAAGHFDVAKQLVKAGADTTVRDAQGRLPKEAGKKGERQSGAGDGRDGRDSRGWGRGRDERGRDSRGWGWGSGRGRGGGDGRGGTHLGLGFELQGWG
ncbi:ankyrin repeat-containing domain protein [Ochromonadaceae sp. CCMP2298]|nr:ankyrin repeat-containing domain protein [Ochromonadaceae sp. CCMP2298]